MTILTGLVYPGLVTIMASVFFNQNSKGSLIERKGIIIGSKLIGQNFDSRKYFWSRPSFINYNPIPSGASNLGPLNPQLLIKINQNKLNFIQVNRLKYDSEIPPEMVTASGSGLDPHISPAAALLQVSRVAEARGMNKVMQDQIVYLINEMTEKRQFSILGEPRINVILLNLKLDSIK